MAAVTPQSKQRHSARRRSTAARVLVLLALTFTLTLLAPALASAIPRDATLARGLTWINAQVPYSQTRYYAGYRTDCSGFVSMCWALPSSYNTRTLYRVAYPISADDLQPGDALLKAGYHVRLFAGWVDETQTRYVAYEETSPGAVQTIKSIDSDLGYGYIPYRYNGIGASAAPWNVLKNGSFDWWSGNNAIHWGASRDASGTVVSRRRRDSYISPLSGLGIVNRSTVPGTFAEVQQNTPIEGGATYLLTGVAWTDRDPAAVRIRLLMYDAAGRTLVDTSTIGSTGGIPRSGWGRFSLGQTAPSGATSATVSLMLDGGSYVATGTPGTVVFDDVQMSVSSPASVYRFYNRSVGAHFYTISGPERDGVIASLWPTYDYEGVAYRINTSTNTQNLYRFYNRRNGTHFYTASEAERDNVIRTLGGVYTYEGGAYCVSRSAVPGAVTVYRFYNARNGTHFYTASAAERDDVMRRLGSVYRYEGPAFFLAP